MSYIGRDVDNISNVEKLDNITFSGTTTYALTKNSVAFTPSGANNILISIDGIVQQNNFTVSGTNIVFDFSPTSSNTCNWILHYGTGLISTPADNSVTTARLVDDAVTYSKIQNVSATDKILGRDSSGAGVIEEITPANLRTMINVADGANAYTHPNHTGEITSTNDGATVVADNIIDEANLKVSNAPTNDYVLTAQSGNTGGLTWAEAGGGAFTKLLTATASNSSSLEFNSTYINSTYNRYLFLFTKVTPATDNQPVEVEHSVNNGTSNVTGTTDYVQHMQYNGQNSNEYYHLSGNAQSGAWLTNGNIGSGFYEGYDGEMWFSRDNSKFSNATTTIVGTNSNNCMVWDGAYSVYSGGINFIRFKFASGNITAGSITLYGVEN